MDIISEVSTMGDCKGACVTPSYDNMHNNDEKRNDRVSIDGGIETTDGLCHFVGNHPIKAGNLKLARFEI
jgi:hypothetical protein